MKNLFIIAVCLSCVGCIAKPKDGKIRHDYEKTQVITDTVKQCACGRYH